MLQPGPPPGSAALNPTAKSFRPPTTAAPSTVATMEESPMHSVASGSQEVAAVPPAASSVVLVEGAMMLSQVEAALMVHQTYPPPGPTTTAPATPQNAAAAEAASSSSLALIGRRSAPPLAPVDTAVPELGGPHMPLLSLLDRQNVQTGPQCLKDLAAALEAPLPEPDRQLALRAYHCGKVGKRRWRNICCENQWLAFKMNRALNAASPPYCLPMVLVYSWSSSLHTAAPLPPSLPPSLHPSLPLSLQAAGVGMVVTLLICWLDLLVERQVQLQARLLRAASPSATSPSSSPTDAAAVVAGLRDVAKRRQDVFLLVDAVLRFVTGVRERGKGSAPSTGM